MSETKDVKKKYVKPKIESIDVSVKDNVMASVDAVSNCTAHSHNCNAGCDPTP